MSTRRYSSAPTRSWNPMYSVRPYCVTDKQHPTAPVSYHSTRTEAERVANTLNAPYNRLPT